MLDVALKFLRDEINAALALRTGSDAVKVLLTRIAEETGKYAFAIDNIGCSVINIEEERVFKAQMPDYATVNGQQVATSPELKLNLHLLFAAHFTHYDQALKYLALILTFFQSHPVFTSDRYPALAPACGKLVAELISFNYEQLNQVWAYLGAKHLPSVVYRVRLVTLQEREPSGIKPPLTSIATTFHSR
ncbi:DUF4255 domain-containing protein [Desulfobulbus sp.]|uniref:DUF4255 domain-containing protein n=1 Tax=Desulfobulbus sp. TaxID=895 RepID=UPI00286F370F|nr:DUF4255 domain-containing protein [Desulfobulbus sp.]